MCPPIESEDGLKSDHGIIIAEATLRHTDRFTIRKIQVRPRTTRGNKKFEERIKSCEWESVIDAPTVDEMVERLEALTGAWMDEAFPTRTFKLKNTDLPWIIYEIKAAIKKRKRIFAKTEKRTVEWKKAKEETDKMITESKKSFFEKMKKTAVEKRSSALYYRAVSKIKDKEKPPDFDVRSLFPGLCDRDVADKVAEFFNEISVNFVPITECLNVHQPGPPIHVTPRDVEDRIRSCKRPKSMVTCDIFPDLALRYVAQLSVPLAAIFNRCFAEESWPSIWKAETVVVIPKTDAPEGLNDLRNLSCTPLFSKLMEFFVLEQLKKETKLRSNQYGGRKGSSCEHYIIKLLTEIHETLDQKDSVCNLLAVDFRKAFNTMDHAACLGALRDNGASEYTISIVQSFLANRTMNVRIGSTLSSPRPIRGGSPQGTLLGNLLFTLSTNRIED